MAADAQVIDQKSLSHASQSSFTKRCFHRSSIVFPCMSLSSLVISVAQSIVIVVKEASLAVIFKSEDGGRTGCNQ
jgi:hypothetical protein